MDTTFYQAHIKTICELKELADKHNSYLNFGVNHDYGPELNDHLVEENGFDPEELVDLGIENPTYSIESIWFEITERKTNTTHRLVYTEARTSFYFDRDCLDEDEVKPETIQKLLDEDELEAGFINLYSGTTHIRGFGNKGVIQNNLVYRAGMALKFFSDYVCDYFNEPRIERTY